MGKFFCPECGYEGNEPICPHCNIAAESLDMSEEQLADSVSSGQAKYPSDLVEEEKSEDLEENI